MFSLVSRREPAARRPVIIRTAAGGFIARGESARRLSLVSGLPTVTSGASVAVQFGRAALPGILGALAQSAYRAVVAGRGRAA